MTNDLLTQTWQALLTHLRHIGKDGLMLALSGGVDSTLLAFAAQQAGVTPLMACTFRTVLTTEEEQASARSMAQQLGLRHCFATFDALAIPQVAQNLPDRCYHCKKQMMTTLRDMAEVWGIPTVADGTNADDLTVYRPGTQACAELGICHPLAACGISKATVRALAKLHGLSTHDKPSAPCLASRFPYRTALSADALRKVEQGEQLLRKLGFTALRLRCHDDLLRIEVPAAQLAEVLTRREAISAALHGLGFSYITLDLDGLQSGRFDMV